MDSTMSKHSHETSYSKKSLREKYVKIKNKCSIKTRMNKDEVVIVKRTEYIKRKLYNHKETNVNKVRRSERLKNKLKINYEDPKDDAPFGFRKESSSIEIDDDVSDDPIETSSSVSLHSSDLDFIVDDSFIEYDTEEEKKKKNYNTGKYKGKEVNKSNFVIEDMICTPVSSGMESCDEDIVVENKVEKKEKKNIGIKRYFAVKRKKNK